MSISLTHEDGYSLFNNLEIRKRKWRGNLQFDYSSMATLGSPVKGRGAIVVRVSYQGGECLKRIIRER